MCRQLFLCWVDTADGKRDLPREAGPPSASAVLMACMRCDGVRAACDGGSIELPDFKFAVAFGSCWMDVPQEEGSTLCTGAHRRCHARGGMRGIGGGSREAGQRWWWVVLMRCPAHALPGPSPHAISPGTHGRMVCSHVCRGEGVEGVAIWHARNWVRNCAVYYEMHAVHSHEGDADEEGGQQ
jgi:hypothetical protein